jgi:ComF family protein
MLEHLVGFLYPPDCPGCGRAFDRLRAADLCAGCTRKLERVQPGCLRCARPGHGPLCTRCLGRPPAFDEVLVQHAYRPGSILARLLRSWKYHRDPRAGRALLGVFSRCMRTSRLYHDLIVPVPLHPVRLASRGFNQSLMLAASLVRGRADAPPLAPRLLRKRRRTPPQALLPRRLRGRDLTHEYFARGRIPGQRVLLIDDILTTGATANACARRLRDAGAVRVDVAILARSHGRARP